ncbi:sugar MFS transporter [Tahibacter amnicola]|uniref:Sugar MFS transporter n=1 Tax=Tahibacter amnicola TaxID=2976241 RepID=A0ABY6BLS2_9GAMM|nr:sugar MFS transporter [Tahibacter amnicola]UXI70432.1 sugar MFS transporter [Tahibacter amnicola]
MPPARTASTRVALVVVTSIFFMWGLLTSLNDVLIPHLKAVFDLNYTRAMLVQFAFFGAYLLVSIPAGKVVDRVGYKQGIVIGLLVAGAGALLFLPAAASRSYEVFLGALFILASGIVLLQVSANPYVSLLGDPRHAASRLNLAQAFNSLGHAVSLPLGGMLILGGTVLGADAIAALAPADLAAYQLGQAKAVQIPYAGLALILLALAGGVWAFQLPALREATEAAARQKHRFADVLRHAHVRWGVLAIFLYVGAEVAIGSIMVNYLAQPSIGNMDAATAAERYVVLYPLGAMLGRFLGSALLRRVDVRLMLAAFAGMAALLLGVTMTTEGRVAMWSVIAIGLFNSILFPTIFTLAIERLGPLTEKASSLLVMAIFGGAVVPLLQGAAADRFGVQSSFTVPLLCYVYIAWYAWRGSRVTGTVSAPAPAQAVRA